MSNVVEGMSEEEFDKEFENMMNTPIEEDEKAAPEGENNGVQEEQETEEVEKEEVTETIEQPESEKEEPEEEENPGEEETQETEGEVEDNTDSKESETETEIENFDFNTVPRDQIIPKDIAVNGVQVRATMDELEEGFKKGMNYTQKMQEIAPHRKAMGIMKDNQLTEADLNLLIEAKGGNKEALAKLLMDSKTDPFELNLEAKEDYTPKDYGKEVVDVEIQTVKDEILADTEYSQVVEEAIQKMPEDMYNMVSANAQGWSSLYKDVKEGVYQKVMPEVMKQQALYGNTEPTIATYLKIANLLGEKDTPKSTEVKAPEKKVDKAELNNKRKKAASSTNVDKNKSSKSYIEEDLEKLSDEDFDKEFEKMMGRSIDEYK